MEQYLEREQDFISHQQCAISIRIGTFGEEAYKIVDKMVEACRSIGSIATWTNKPW